MQQWPIVIIIGFSALFFGYMFYMQKKAKQLEGEKINNDIPILSKADLQKNLLIYAYSPTCGPCKSLSPMLDKLQAEGLNILKYDITSDMESTVQLNIRGTPTFMFIKNKQIDKIVLGGCKENKIREFLSN
jgi:thiol-disulfide isomerase/thioredoxin